MTKWYTIRYKFSGYEKFSRPIEAENEDDALQEFLADISLKEDRYYEIIEVLEDD